MDLKIVTIWLWVLGGGAVLLAILVNIDVFGHPALYIDFQVGTVPVSLPP